ELLRYGASWSTVVEEGEPVKTAGYGATTSAIRAMTSGAGRSTHGGGFLDLPKMLALLHVEFDHLLELVPATLYP
ncbi:hypothetical protein Tco_1413288, partial [Tanacetum coccineum]